MSAQLKILALTKHSSLFRQRINDVEKVFKLGLKKFKEIRRELSRKQEKLKKSPQVVHEV
jgi:hypothetical protein